MIFKNGVQWEGWKDHLKKTLANRTEIIARKAKFEITERYSGMRKMGDGKSQPAFKKTYAASVGIPVEFQWVDENGESCLIRYVEHVEKRREGKEMLTVEHPGAIYITNGKFDMRKNSLELFWFYMVSPFCENGFSYDMRWGLTKSQLDRNQMVRTEQPKYRYVNLEDTRKAEIEMDNLVYEAKTMIRKMSETDKREVYAALNQTDADVEDIDVITIYLTKEAETNPKGLIEADKKNVSYLAVVNQAEQKELVKYKKTGRAWMLQGQEEAVCLVPQGKNPTEYFVEWLRTKDDGGQVLTILKEGLKSEKKEHIFV